MLGTLSQEQIDQVLHSEVVWSQGCSPEIADTLFISERTVKFHTAALYRTLGVSSRAEAVSLTWQHHFIA